MSEERHCAECGGVIPPDARQGPCARCLGLEAGSEEPGPGVEDGREKEGRTPFWLHSETY